MTTGNTDLDLPRWTRVAAYAVSTDAEGRLLLVRLAPGYPATGKWTLPGGGLDFGEDPEVGALRELEEESGLIGLVESLAFVKSWTAPQRPGRGIGELHSVQIAYRVRIVGGELRDESDESTDSAAWFSIAAARQLPLVDLAIAALDYIETH